MKMRVKAKPSKVEKRVVSIVGSIIEAGEILPSDARIPTIEAGINCKEVAFKTKNAQDAYSGSGD